MATTLTVKNETSGSITLGKGSGAVTIGAGKEGELPADLLQTRAFSDQLVAGRLSFVLTPNPDEARVKLARRVFPGLLRSVGTQFQGLAGRLENSTERLQSRRLEYNHNWKQTKFVLDAAEEAANPATNLAKSALHLAINTKPEEAVEAQLQSELDALEATDPTSIDDLPKFLDKIRLKEAEVRKARDARETAEDQYVDPYHDLAKRLEMAAKLFQDVDPDRDIGTEVSPFPA